MGRCSAPIWTICAKCVALSPRHVTGCLWSHVGSLLGYDGDVPDQPISAMTGEHVLDVTQHLLSLSANDYTRSSTTACTRTFLRFLQWSGLNDQDLARFVPRTPCYRLAHVPPRLAWEDVRRVIDAIDVTAPSGIRDRALLLLLATTGLRNKELRSLELQDIRWRAAEVLVRRTKARRDRIVPLLQEAGAALAEYVLHARPRINSQRVFLSYVPPVGPFRIQRRHFEDCAFSTSSEAGLRFPASPAPTWYAIASRHSSSGSDAPSTRSRTCLAIGASTEALGVDACDLQLDRPRPQVLLRGKGRKERIVPIPEDSRQSAAGADERAWPWKP